MNAQPVHIHFHDCSEIHLSVAESGIVLPELEATPASERAVDRYTKIFADGTFVSGDSDRTDHVALVDNDAGLMWSVESLADKDGERMSQEDCIKACSDLRLLARDDWRLPTRAELAALIDDTRHEPAIDPSLFPRVKPSWHWTSTPCAWSASSAWGVLFDSGGVYGYHRSYYGFALAVRRAGQ